MKKRHWSARQSLLLSQAATYIAAGGLLAAMFFLRTLLSGGYLGDYFPSWLTEITLVVFYVCCPAAWAAIGALLRLLQNIKTGRIFIRQNITLLRLLSWCCVWVALAALAVSFRYLPFALFFIAAGFLAIILRVVKNVMEEATLLREENDLTI